MDPFRVRPARIEDHERLSQIYRDASLSNPGDRAALQAHPRALVLDKEVVRSGRAWVATRTDGEVAGFARASPSASGVLELDDLFVDPRWQRQGAGSSLVRAVVEESRREGIFRLEVTANDHALEFYRAAGFDVDGRVETEFGAGSRMHLDLGRGQLPPGRALSR